MTVLQFRPRTPEPTPKQTPSPAHFIKAWLCIAIGLYISPWISWLEVLSESEEHTVDPEHR